jgi:hypothetical protein
VEVEAKIAAKYPTRQEATLKEKNFLIKLALLQFLIMLVCWGLLYLVTIRYIQPTFWYEYFCMLVVETK